MNAGKIAAQRSFALQTVIKMCHFIFRRDQEIRPSRRTPRNGKTDGCPKRLRRFVARGGALPGAKTDAIIVKFIF